MRRLRAAFGCLTVLPVGPRGGVEDVDLGGSLVWFPVVGLVIGALLVATQWVAARGGAPLVTGAIVLLMWIVVTGALHLDGVGDVCDGWYGGRTREERLRIMKDPHVGAMAVVGIASLLVMKFALVSSLPRPTLVKGLWLAPCLGRYAMVLLGTTLPYARAEGGTAAAFVRHASRGSLIGATALALPASLLIGGGGGLMLLGVAVLGSALLRAVFRRTLGGITGDALGATGELIEALVLLGLALGTAA